MTSVGETLRRERQGKHLTLEQVSRETKINPRFLDAIENDRLDHLPGGVFAKSFVRQYARVLGLDAEELVSEAEKAIHPDAEVPSFGSAAPERVYRVPKVRQWDGGSHPGASALPSLALVVAVMLVCSGIYAWWQRSRAPAPVPAAAAVQKQIQPPAPQPAAPAPASPAGHTAAVPAPSEATTPVTLHVSLAADETTWVRAWADGQEVMTATLEPGVVKTVDAADSIRIRTGNAGSLQITVDGKSVGPIGPKGQIRVVEVTPKGVQIEVPPAPAAPAPALPPAPL
jgi:cytoskeleton protein RodZ